MKSQFEDASGLLRMQYIDVPTNSGSGSALAVGRRRHIEFDADGPDTFPGPYVASLSGALVDPIGCGVFDAAGTLIDASLWDREHRLRSYPDGQMPLKPVATVSQDLGSLLTLWGDNYYHWLIDALPRLGLIRTADISVQGFLVPQELNAFQRSSLTLLGIDQEEMVKAGPDLVSPHTLVWASPAAPIGHCSGWVANWLRESFVRPAAGGTDTRTSRRRLYVARETRRVVNERELLCALERFDFEVVRPEYLDFAEQVALFADAGFIVGPHGAGLANVVFAQQADVIELFAPTYINTALWNVARASGHRYAYSVGRTVPLSRVKKMWGIWVDVAQLSSEISRRLDEPLSDGT